MFVCRTGAAAALALSFCGYAAAQSYNSATTVATVVDISIPDTTEQQNSYNVPGETGVATPESTMSSVANYGATAKATASSSVGAMTAYATAMQPLNGLISYAEARSQPTIDDFATVTGPQAIGTPVTLTLVMIVTGSYATPAIDDAPDLNFAGDSLSWQDHTNGTESNGPILGSNGAGKSVSPLTATFNTTVGASIELNYGLDTWVYVAGNSSISDTETSSLQLVGLYANSNLPGVKLISDSGHPYVVPSPSGLAAMTVGTIGLLLRRRRK